MGHLKKFARNRKVRGGKTEVVTARIPTGLYTHFKDYCDDLGLSISEAVYILVEKEMSISEEVSYTKPNTNDLPLNTEEYKPTTKQNKAYTNLYTKRFTTKQWQIDGELPCPTCKEWVSASNYARHAKGHDSTTQEVFSNSENLVVVDEMIKRRGGK